MSFDYRHSFNLEGSVWDDAFWQVQNYDTGLQETQGSSDMGGATAAAGPTIYTNEQRTYDLINKLSEGAQALSDDEWVYLLQSFSLIQDRSVHSQIEYVVSNLITLPPERYRDIFISLHTYRQEAAAAKFFYRPSMAQIQELFGVLIVYHFTQTQRDIYQKFFSIHHPGVNLFESLDHYKRDPIDGLLSIFGKEMIQQDVCEKLDVWLKNLENAEISLDIKTFAHVFGDSFIIKSKLEGNSVRKIVKYLIEVITYFRYGNELDSLLIDFQEIYRWATLFKDHPIEKDLNKLSELSSQIVGQLQTTGRVVLPGGWKTVVSGHAMIYEIQKEESGFYKFSIFNTGQGISYHMSAMRQRMKKICPLFSLSNLEPGAIENPEFFNQLLALQMMKGVEGNKAGADDIYQLLFYLFPEAIVDDYSRMPHDKLMSEQTAGVCSYESLISYMRIKLPLKEFLQVKFSIRFTTLSLWYLGITKGINGGVDAAFVTKQTLQRFSSAIRKNLQRPSGISKEYLLICCELIKRTERMIGPTKTTYRLVRQEGLKLISTFKSYRGVVSIKNAVLSSESDKTAFSRLNIEELNPFRPDEEGALPIEMILNYMNQQIPLGARGESHVLRATLEVCQLHLWDALPCDKMNESYSVSVLRILKVVRHSQDDSTPKGVLLSIYLHAILILLARKSFKALYGEDLADDISFLHPEIYQLFKRETQDLAFSELSYRNRFKELVSFFEDEYAKSRNFFAGWDKSNEVLQVNLNLASDPKGGAFLLAERLGQKSKKIEEREFAYVCDEAAVIEFFKELCGAKEPLGCFFVSWIRLYKGLVQCLDPVKVLQFSNNTLVAIKFQAFPALNLKTNLFTRFADFKQQVKLPISDGHVKFVELITYFESNIPEFFTPGGRASFKNHLFDFIRFQTIDGDGEQQFTTLIEFELRAGIHSSAITRLVKFLSVVRDLALQNGNVDVLNFVIELEDGILEISPMKKIIEPAHYELIKNKGSLADQIACGFNFLKRFQEVIDWNYAKLLFRLLALTATQNAYCVHRENLRKMSAETKDKLAELLFEATPEELTFHLRELFTDLQLQIVEPVNFSQDTMRVLSGLLEFHILTGEVFIHGHERIVLPEEIANLEIVKYFNGGRIIPDFISTDKGFKSPSTGVSVQFFKLSKSIIEGLVINAEAMQKRIVDLLGRENEELSNDGDLFLYCSFDKNSRMYSQDLESLIDSLPYYLRSRDKYEFWLGCEIKKTPTLLILDHVKKQLIKVFFNGKQCVIKNVSTQEQLAEIESLKYTRGTEVLFLEEIIEDSLIWKDKQGNISTIEFPSLALTFEYQPKHQFREYPGYSVCYEEECPIPNMRSAIYLKDQNRTELVIIPGNRFELIADENYLVGQFNLAYSNQKFVGHRAFFRKPTEKYFSGSGEDLLYLVEFMIASKDYDGAIAYLKRSFSALKSSETYVKKLNGIITFGFQSACSTELYAVLMHLFSISLELRGEVYIPPQRMISIYHSYIQHYNHLKYRLNETQENKVINYFYSLAVANPRSYEYFLSYIKRNHVPYFENKNGRWSNNETANSVIFSWSDFRTGFEKFKNPCKDAKLDLGFFVCPKKPADPRRYHPLLADSFISNYWGSERLKLSYHLFSAIKKNDRKMLFVLKIVLFKFFYQFRSEEKKSGKANISPIAVSQKFSCVAMLLLAENFLDPAFYAEQKDQFLKLIDSAITRTDKMPEVIDHYWLLLVEKLNQRIKKQQQIRKLAATQHNRFIPAADRSDFNILQFMPDTPLLSPKINLTLLKFQQLSNDFNQEEALKYGEKVVTEKGPSSSEMYVLSPAVKRIKIHENGEVDASSELFSEIVERHFEIKQSPFLNFPIEYRGASPEVSKMSLFTETLRGLELDFLSYQKNKRLFGLKPNASLEEIQEQLQEYLRKFSIQVVELKELIERRLLQVDSYQSLPSEGLAFEILRSGGTVKGLAVEDSVDWYAFSQMPQSEALRSLYEFVEQYVVAENRCLALKLALEKIFDCKACGDGRKLHLEHQLWQVLTSPLFFSKVLMNPSVLYFQYKTGKLLRRKQLDFFSRAAISTKEIFQLGCGEGKTKVLTVLLSLYLNSQKKQVVNIVPSANFETNYRDLQEQYLAITDDFVSILQLSRHAPLTKENIKEYEDKVNNARQNHGIIICEPQTLQSLQLKYFEYLHKCTNDRDDGLEDFLNRYDAILKSFIDEGVAIVDEVHQIFEPLKDLNYSLEDATVLPSFHFEIPAALIRTAFEVFLADEAGGFDNLNSLNSRFHFIHKLAEKIVEKRSEFYLHVESADSELLLACLTFNRMALDPDSEVIRKKLLSWFESLDNLTKDKILLLRAHLHVYLPHCLSLRWHVDYGRSQDEKVKVAVPYTSNMKPAVNSHFESVETLVNCTYLLYLKEGLSLSQVGELVEYWQMQDRKMRVVGTVDQESVVSKAFSKKWSKQPLQSVEISNVSALRELYQVFSKDIQSTMEYVATFVFSGFNIQEYKLSSNAQDLGRTLFPKVIGFSGTPSNFLTYPVEMELHHDSEANGELCELLTNREVSTLEIHQTIDVKELVNDDAVCVILDPAAYFEGVTNEEVAKRLLRASGIKTKAVLYFDTQSNKMMLQFKDGSCKEFDDNLCKVDERITYLDQEHVTGVDTPQPVAGIGCLIINKGLTMTDLFQSVKRLRGLGRGQKIRLVLPQHLCDEVHQLTGDLVITQGTVILWTLINEVKGLSRTLLPSFVNQIHNVFRTKAFKMIIEHDRLRDKLVLFQKYRSLLLTKIEHNEFRAQGGFLPPKSPIKIVVEALADYERSYGDLLDTTAKKTLKTILNRANQLLPESFLDAGEKSLDVTAQKEQEQLSELEVESQIEKEKLAYKPITWDPAREAKILLSEKVSEFGAFEFFGIDKVSTVFSEALRISIPDIGFHPRIFMTQNFLSKIPRGSSKGLFVSDTPAGNDLFLRELQKVQFFAVACSVARGALFSNYWILSNDEAGAFRERLLNRKIQLLETEELSLYDTRGDFWGGVNTKFDDLQRIGILAQLQFLNGETHFSGIAEECLSHWIASDKTVQKINFFHRRRRLMKNRERLPAFEGSMLQRLFKQKG